MQQIERIDNEELASAEHLVKDRLQSAWFYIIVFMNLLHIELSIDNLSSQDTEIIGNNKIMGLSVLMAIVSLNTYLVQSRDYSLIPNVFLETSDTISKHLIGIFPFILGIIIGTYTFLNFHFKFMSFRDSSFAIFWLGNNDNVFDTFTGIKQVNYVVSVLVLIWVWFGKAVVINITLAEVSDGFVR